MKKITSSLLMTLVFGACASVQGASVDTDRVAVQLRSLASVTVNKVTPPNANLLPSTAKLGKAVPKEPKVTGKESSLAWQYFSFPIIVRGANKSDLPYFVPEMQLTVYALFAKDRKKFEPSECVLLTKTINYTNIRLTDYDPKNAKRGEGAKASSVVNVGLFISPRDAIMIEESWADANDSDPVSGDLNDKLIGIAIDAKVGEDSCLTSSDKVPSSYILDPSLKRNKITGKWWESTKVKSGGAQLMTVNETPFAPFYVGQFPNMSTTYGADTSAPAALAPSADAADKD